MFKMRKSVCYTHTLKLYPAGQWYRYQTVLLVKSTEPNANRISPNKSTLPNSSSPS